MRKDSIARHSTQTYRVTTKNKDGVPARTVLDVQDESRGLSLTLEHSVLEHNMPAKK